MRVLYVQYTNPAGYPPLQHSSRILANNGWEILFLGTGAHGADKLEFPQHPRIRVKQLPFCPAGWRQKLHYATFTLWVLFWTLRWRPRWIYSSDPLSCPVTALLSFVPGVHTIYHEHDSPDAGAESACSSFRQCIVKMRSILAKYADVCILPNEHRVARFRKDTATRRPVRQVWNCPALEEVKNTDQQDSGNFTVFYHGNIAPSLLPVTVLESLTRVPDEVILRVAGYVTVGNRGYLEWLEKQAARLGLAGRFKYLGVFPRYALLDHCRNGSVGIALMRIDSNNFNEQAMVGASNKPFDYLACGLALLVSDLPDWRKTFVEPGYGRACDPNDAESIARQLLWFVEHPEETHSMGIKGRQRILSEWNYERQFSPVLQAIGAMGVQD